MDLQKHKLNIIVATCSIVILTILFASRGCSNKAEIETLPVYNPPGGELQETQKVSTIELKPQISFPVNWSSAGAVVADNLKLKNVNKIAGGILVDANTGRILWSKHSNKPMKIASMTKMMTTLLAVEAVRQGRADFKQKIVVSKAAQDVGGSQVYLAKGEVFTLEELLKSIMIKSANDSSHLVAETIGGNHNDFVKAMNAKAKKLGMLNTTFYNPHGLPLGGKHNLSTSFDMAILARELLKYPEVLKWSSTWTDKFRDGKMLLVNHNKLVNPVSGVEGVDGLKTGYYSTAGFSVTATALRDNRRMISVVIGVRDKRIRNSFSGDLIDWGYDKINISNSN